MFTKAFCALILAAGAMTMPHNKRSSRTKTGVTFYAYGDGINGMPISADSKGYAYVSTASVQPANLTSLQWNITTDGSTAWTTNLFDTTGTFYIIAGSDAFNPAGFVFANEPTPSGTATTGFVIYGSQVMYNTGSTYEAQFWATFNDGNFEEAEIFWNGSGAMQDSAVPVTLETTAPRT